MELPITSWSQDEYNRACDRNICDLRFCGTDWCPPALLQHDREQDCDTLNDFFDNSFGLAALGACETWNLDDCYGDFETEYKQDDYCESKEADSSCSISQCSISRPQRCPSPSLQCEDICSQGSPPSNPTSTRRYSSTSSSPESPRGSTERSSYSSPQHRDETQSQPQVTRNRRSSERLTIARMASGSKLVTILDITNNSVLDVCSFDNCVYVTISNGDVLKMTTQGDEDQSRDHPPEHDIRVIKSPITIHRLVSFGGYLYGLSGSKLYRLDSRTYGSSDWNWLKCDWTPKDRLQDIGTTLMGEHIWLVTESGRGHLYTMSNASHIQPKLVKTVEMGTKQRVYGLDDKIYIDIDTYHQTAVKMPSNETIQQFRLGALTYDGDVIRVPQHLEHKIKGVRIVNWEPMYLVII